MHNFLKLSCSRACFLSEFAIGFEMVLMRREATLTDAIEG